MLRRSRILNKHIYSLSRIDYTLYVEGIQEVFYGYIISVFCHCCSVEMAKINAGKNPALIIRVNGWVRRYDSRAGCAGCASRAGCDSCTVHAMGALCARRRSGQALCAMLFLLYALLSAE